MAANESEAPKAVAPTRIERLAERLPRFLTELPARQAPTRVAKVLVGLAFVGLALATVHAIMPPPAKPTVATGTTATGTTTTPTTAQPVTGSGPLGVIPDLNPMDGVTSWFSNVVSDGNTSAIDGLKGTFLTPVDPLKDKAIGSLYGMMVVVAIPMLILLAAVIGVMVMTSRSSGEGAYSTRALLERYIVGAVLMGLGIFLVSLASNFLSALNQGIVAAGLPSGSIGSPDTWPASGGVFHVLQVGHFDPSIAQGCANSTPCEQSVAYNTGAWLVGGLLNVILVTLVNMMNMALTGLETILIIVSPFCLLAYATHYSAVITFTWLKMMAVVYLVRFAWAVLFVLYSLFAAVRTPIGSSGVPVNPATLADTNYLLAIATGAAFLMFLVPIILVPLAVQANVTSAGFKRLAPLLLAA